MKTKIEQAVDLLNKLDRKCTYFIKDSDTTKPYIATDDCFVVAWSTNGELAMSGSTDNQEYETLKEAGLWKEGE